MRGFEIRHIVGFEDTNVVGNVYYVNHLRWQGRCRELFIREYAPQLVERLGSDLAVATVRCSCEYLSELFAFDEVSVRMYLGALTQSRMTMEFDYWRVTGAGEQLVARGEQEVACLQREGGQLRPAAWPATLVSAARSFERPQVLQP
jgi:enediyne biosynthesis thioesterase